MEEKRKVCHTDRKKCKVCRYSYFYTSGKFMWCNYLEETGNKRPHDGCICYGFEKCEKYHFKDDNEQIS
jgi:hypothetical protein